MRRSSDKTISYSVIYEEAPEGGYVAFVPSLPGCHTQGDTIEEAEKNIQEAIELYLESLEAHGEKIPQERRVLQGKIEVFYPTLA
ncbi:MAG: type II toxin-antitoxin system HicB family antitoxin [Candidatus Blackburnbacteria bacterium]|nr:type II toxin-antitoxin system HicB family antitoxin [Candidatus Blackburnbacteria bacterium]